LLIDEYQDFNSLEVSLLSRLSEKNQILIVGDDDQSLYDFKHAIPDDIRAKASSKDYESFELPYCSRCTSVIIDAYNKLVDVAKSKGHLSNRASKQFLYFPSQEKDVISNTHNKIIVKKNVYPRTLAYHIDDELKKLLNPRDSSLPSVLIICPTRDQIEKLEKALAFKGYRNIDATQKHSYDRTLEGLIYF
jgi:superfamily I DNA/RNA helicase